MESFILKSFMSIVRCIGGGDVILDLIVDASVVHAVEVSVDVVDDKCACDESIFFAHSSFFLRFFLGGGKTSSESNSSKPFISSASCFVAAGESLDRELLLFPLYTLSLAPLSLCSESMTLFEGWWCLLVFGMQEVFTNKLLFTNGTRAQRKEN